MTIDLLSHFPYFQLDFTVFVLGVLLCVYLSYNIPGHYVYYPILSFHLIPSYFQLSWFCL